MQGKREEANHQAEKFKELARQLEADEDEERFEEQVRRIAKRPPNVPPAEPKE